MYSLIEGNGAGIFSIDPTNGRVFIPLSGSPGLDFDEQSTHILVVQAQNNAQLVQKARLRITIKLISNHINFTTIPNPTIQETSSVGTHVLQLMASGGRGSIEYSIISGNYRGNFAINQGTGLVTVNKVLDFETTPSYTLRVRAMSTEIIVKGERDYIITIQDVNESPIFITSCSIEGCIYSVDENELPDTFVGQILADDPDQISTPNGTLTYEISNGVPFYIDPSGNIQTTRLLDRENSGSYNFTVTVTDECFGCNLIIFTSVMVIVNDRNDNSPLFTNLSSTILVNKNTQLGAIVAEFRATDEDIGENADITFTLSPNDTPFSLSSTGTLTVTGVIDYEVIQFYTVIITASNTGSKQSSFLTIEIHISNENENTDYNDNKLVFTNLSSTVLVNENTQLGAIVAEFRATDADIGGNDEIIFTHSPTDTPFSLSFQGTLTVTGVIDYEVTQLYTVIVTATDSRSNQSSFLIIKIYIINENDNTPMFRGEPYEATAMENSTMNAIVPIITLTAVDADLGEHGQIEYHILSGNSLKYFTLNSTTGSITASNNLDRETISSVTLVVEARDRGTPQTMSDHTNVTITILDINDNPPIFMPIMNELNENSPPFNNLSSTVFVNENTQLGGIVIEFRATDADIGENADITFSFSPTDTPFSLSSTGTLTVTGVIDYEVTQFYTVIITASNTGGNQSSLLSTKLQIINENDNTPMFTGEPYEATVMENSTMNAIIPIIILTALDADLGEHGRIEYQILRGNSLKYFTLNSTSGAITANNNLDRETTSSVTLVVEARDRGTPQTRSVRTNVTITILDINDNPPIFMPIVNELNENSPLFNNLSSTVLANENTQLGGIIAEFRATDEDIGENADISFSLSPTDTPFSLSSTGTLTVTGVIDYEVTQFYTVIITASNTGGNQSSLLSTKIQIINENDNTPMFTGEPYEATAMENSTMNAIVPIITLTAMDADLGQHGQIEYLILRGNSLKYFTLNSTTGAITASNNLDRETISSVTLVVEARDRGTPQTRNVRTNVTITVSDINDNPPIFMPIVNELNENSPLFNNLSSTVIVNENTQLGVIVAKFRATDADIGRNADITFTLSPIDTPFSLSSTGTLTVTGIIDYEVTQFYTVIVTASNTGGNQSSLLSTKIQIINENDNTPMFTGEPYEATAMENSTMNAIVPIITLTAVDADIGEHGQIEYLILRGNLLKYFTLNSTTGAITASNNLDRETISSVTLVVEARDRGAPQTRSDRTNVTITILDINDNPPIFMPIVNDLNENSTLFTNLSSSVQVYKNTLLGAIVAEFRATDADIGGNAEITFTLTPTNTPFSLSSTGTLTLTGLLDYEVTQFYTVIITASNTGGKQSSSLNTEIHISNINDNYVPNVKNPFFTNLTSTVLVNENTQLGATVADFRATDADIGGEAGINFTLSPTDTPFSLNSTGTLTVTGVIDYEVTQFYTVIITATDSGSNQSSFQSIKIHIINENDNTPMFAAELYEATAIENSTINAIVPIITIRAVDADLGEHGQIEYHILSGNLLKYFTLNSTTGSITASNSLDREIISSVTLVVEARDRGTPQTRSDHTNVTIIILDINDNPPIFMPTVNELSESSTLFTNLSSTVLVKENTLLGAIVSEFRATDEDIGENAEIIFTITPTDTPFSLSSTGTLTVTGVIDYEVTQFYTVIITASNTGGNQSSLLSTKIQIINENDNTPMFTGEPYKAAAVENSTMNAIIPIITLTAVDADLGQHGQIEYLILRGNSFQYFTLNSTTGAITANNNLDRETISSVTLVVEARDRGTPQTRSDHTNVTITILDINDNPPIFMPTVNELNENSPLFNNLSSTVLVNENIQLGAIVTEFRATDEDIGENADITFSFSPTDTPFSLSSTGTLTVTGVIDYEVTQFYTVIVTASNTGGNQSSLLSTKIQIINENDNTPMFTGEPYETTAMENSTMNAIVPIITLTAVDADLGQHGQIEYQILRGNSLKYFTLNSTTGAITASNNLDRETISSVTLVVEARDRGTPQTRSDHTNVTITILDINDNPPIFMPIVNELDENSPLSTNLSSTVVVYENTQLGAIVAEFRATDEDIGENADITFTLSPTDIPFSLSSTGTLTVTGVIDYEVTQFYTVIITASNTGGKQSSLLSIEIRIINENDNSLTFTNLSSTVVVEENTKLGAIVAEFRATDADIGGNDEITFTLSPIDTPFSLSSTGTLTVTGVIDYEVTQFYTVIITATESGSDQSSSLSTNIQIINENDNTPMFTGEPYEAAAVENSTINAIVPIITLTAVDADLGQHGQIEYLILRGNSLKYFTLNSTTGAITASNNLDRETISSVTLVVEARDRGTPQTRSDHTNVTITILDINDNPPIFMPILNGLNESNPLFTNLSSTVLVNENMQLGAIAAEYRATDADIEGNAEITFTLSPTDTPFSLSSTGTLNVTGVIDYEVTQFYTVVITASNTGSDQFSILTTKIHIVNENDNTPMFTGEPYEAATVENSTMNAIIPIIILTAVDADLGEQGQIEYLILRGNSLKYFTLNSTTGAITASNNLDRETISSVTLVVEARDRGTPQTRSDHTNVTITILDINDNPPIFMPNSYNVQVMEDVQVGNYVLQVLASDLDQPNTPNSDIAYSIISGNSAKKFYILPSGQIQIRNSLDFETTTSYILVVEARVEGFPIMSDTANVTMNIINVNEQPLTLTGIQSVSISEFAPVKSIIAVYLPKGDDRIPAVVTIASGNSERKFVVKQSNGTIISLAASLDYEITTNYTLNITAWDGLFSTSVTLEVQVMDENEFSPSFVGPFNFSILEEQAYNSMVGAVVATDEDRSAVITYQFEHHDKNTEHFFLHPNTGVITTRKVLNRESLEHIFMPPLSQVTIKVLARDDGIPASLTVCNITITLDDINDNPPTFADSSYSGLLLENFPSGASVFTVSATDMDMGYNAEVSYSFILTNNKSSYNPFQINPSTGAIFTVEPLDRELQPYYLFNITASDEGNPPMSSTVSGELIIADINDNSPQFTKKIFYSSITEDYFPGDTIMTFVASDLDEGINGEVEYSILSTENIAGLDARTIFEIDSNSGELAPKSTLDFERSAQLSVSVIAYDKGLPPRTATATLVINVLNIDEEPPFFPNISCDSVISEDVIIGTVVSNCSAIDLDTVASTLHCPITYSMTVNRFFAINPTNGQIFTKALLDRKTNENSVFTITATDSANRSATKLVMLSITDVNDNSPQFLNTPYNYYFTESIISNFTQDFLTLYAFDSDNGSNGTFIFEINRMFRVTSTKTIVEIIARDNGTPQMNNSINVTVTFQSPCQLQKYIITGGGNILSAQLLCSVEIYPSPSFVLVFGRSESLICQIISNMPTQFQWFHNGTALTTIEFWPQNTTGMVLPLFNIRLNHGGTYSCYVSSPIGSLQSLARAAIHGMLVI